MNAKVVEVVLFNPTAEVTRDQIIRAAHALQDAVTKMPGYLDRMLLENEEGQWIDIVYWASLEEAQAAAEKIMQQPEVAPHMVVFEKGETRLMHLTPVPLGVPQG